MLFYAFILFFFSSINVLMFPFLQRFPSSFSPIFLLLPRLVVLCPNNENFVSFLAMILHTNSSVVTEYSRDWDFKILLKWQ